MSCRLCFATACFLAVVFSLPAQDQSVFEPRSAARLSYFEGDVQIDAEPAVTGQLIAYGALVQTGNDSYAEVTIGTGNILRVQENTVIFVEISDATRRVDLRTGGIGAVLNGLDRLSPSLERSRPLFYLKTQGTVAGVRGTSFFAQVEGPGSTYVCTCNGSLEFSGDGYSEFSTEYYHHGARRFVSRPNGRVTVEIAPLLYHDDAEMNDLAARIGETITWSEGY